MGTSITSMKILSVQHFSHCISLIFQCFFIDFQCFFIDFSMRFQRFSLIFQCFFAACPPPWTRVHGPRPSWTRVHDPRPGHPKCHAVTFGPGLLIFQCSSLIFHCFFRACDTVTCSIALNFHSLFMLRASMWRRHMLHFIDFSSLFLASHMGTSITSMKILSHYICNRTAASPPSSPIRVTHIHFLLLFLTNSNYWCFNYNYWFVVVGLQSACFSAFISFPSSLQPRVTAPQPVQQPPTHP